ncbi:MAG: flagellar hook-associated protein FlgL [Planctomycetia bacterium]|nr:flagellar hook-associated protein FlgL [Planctomycetia bacterium]
MTSFYPIPSSRSTNLLEQTRLIQQFNNTQLDLQKLQNAISTGRRIALPGEDPSAAQRGQAIKQLIALKTQAQTNIQAAQSYLDATDTSLSNVAALLTDVRSAAATANSDTSSDLSRQAALQQVDEAITQFMNTANQNFRGRYLFGGSRLAGAPFTQTPDGVVYNGNDGSLNSFVDVGLPYATNASGTDVFGTFSSEVQGIVDLDPALGSIEIGDGTTKKTIDLSSAATIDDVAKLIEANPPTGRTLTVTVTNTGLTVAIDAAGGGNLTIKDVAGGTTAKDLQILTPPLGNGVVPVVGGDLNPGLRLTTRLADLQTASPLDLASGLQITNGGKTYTIDTSGAVTVEDLLNTINHSQANALAEIAPSGDRLIVQSRLSGTDFSIGENGGTTATQLGIRSLTTSTPLADLNYGQGVASIAGTDFTIHRRDGTDLAIDISSATTIGDVLNTINNDPGNLNPATQVVARLAAVGNGIELFDGNLAGTDTLSVSAQFGSDAAIDLGLIPRGQATATAVTGATGDTLTGIDSNPQEVSGVFNSLLRLRDSLANFSHEKLARAVALLDQDFDRLNFARADVGARGQTIDTVKTQLEDETTQLKSDLSNDLDTNLPDAISSLAAKQAALQASLQLAASMFQTTLLNYL